MTTGNIDLFLLMEKPPPYSPSAEPPPPYKQGNPYHPTYSSGSQQYASAPSYPSGPTMPCPASYGYTTPTAPTVSQQRAPVNIVVVQQAQPKPKPNRGFLSGIISDLSKGVNNAARDVTGVASKLYHGNIMNHLTTGSVIQLYFEKTGKTVQIVQSPNGNLILDILGYLSPQAYNAHWIVYQELGNVIKLYNQDNYIGILNGQVVLFKAANPVIAPPETRWKVCQSSSSSEISLQSMYDCSSFLSATADFKALTLSESSVLSERLYFSIQNVSHIGGKN